MYQIYFECIQYKQNENISNSASIIKDKIKNHIMDLSNCKIKL